MVKSGSKVIKMILYDNTLEKINIKLLLDFEALLKVISFLSLIFEKWIIAKIQFY
jgi:hypothetical protein